jgi:hypothetical protein
MSAPLVIVVLLLSALILGYGQPVFCSYAPWTDWQPGHNGEDVEFRVRSIIDSTDLLSQDCLRAELATRPCALQLFCILNLMATRGVCAIDEDVHTKGDRPGPLPWTPFFSFLSLPSVSAVLMLLFGHGLLVANSTK